MTDNRPLSIVVNEVNINQTSIAGLIDDIRTKDPRFTKYSVNQFVTVLRDYCLDTLRYITEQEDETLAFVTRLLTGTHTDLITEPVIRNHLLERLEDAYRATIF